MTVFVKFTPIYIDGTKAAATDIRNIKQVPSRKSSVADPVESFPDADPSWIGMSY